MKVKGKLGCKERWRVKCLSGRCQNSWKGLERKKSLLHLVNWTYFHMAGTLASWRKALSDERVTKRKSAEPALTNTFVSMVQYSLVSQDVCIFRSSYKIYMRSENQIFWTPKRKEISGISSIKAAWPRSQGSCAII